MTKKVGAEDLRRIKEQEYLSVTEAAILSRKGRQTVYDAINSRDLKALRHGERWWVKRSELDRWMESLASFV